MRVSPGLMGFKEGEEELLSPSTHPAQKHCSPAVGGWAHQHMTRLVSPLLFVREGGGAVHLGVGVEALCG